MILFSYGFFGQRLGSTFNNGWAMRPANQPFGAVFVSRLTGTCNAANVSVFAFAIGRDAGVSNSYYDRPEDPSFDVGGATDFIRDIAVGSGGKYLAPGKYDLGPYLSQLAS